MPCLKCGSCCKVFGDTYCVALTGNDISVLSNYFEMSTSEFLDAYTVKNTFQFRDKAVSLFCLKQINNSCIFLSDNMCLVNSIKPMQCMITPLHGFIREDLTGVCGFHQTLHDNAQDRKVFSSFIRSLLESNENTACGSP